ncbi:hypothetical protein HKD25_01640 [Gluconobacter wancherniae]|nr:hypothetical protein [Gluconobacter wancherniae]MBS1061906.1 hypothetical protein [Gluconobacter wancherniae]
MGDSMIRNITGGLCALLLASAFPLSISTACAQGVQSQTEVDGQPGNSAAQMPPQVRADITRAMQYPLPADFMNRASATLGELSQNGIQPPSSQGMSLEATIHQMTRISGLEPILREHGFTPESFVMGMTAFGMTIAASNGQLPAGLPSPNPANVALFQAHPEQVNALMQAMGNPPH